MTNDDERQHLETLLHIHHKNARTLETQIAHHGLNPPINLLNALDHEQHVIATIQAQLHTLAPQLHTPGTTPTLVDPTEFVVERSQNTPAPLAPLDVTPLSQPLRSRQFVRRAAPIRQILWRARARAIRWWTAGGVAFILVVVIVASFLLRPVPNAALVEQMRETPATRSFTLEMTQSGVEPLQLNAVVGDVIALDVVNDTDQVCRWVLFDARPEYAAKLLAGTIPLDHEATYYVSPLLQPGEQTALTFVPFHAGVFSIASLPEQGAPEIWGVLEVR